MYAMGRHPLADRRLIDAVALGHLTEPSMAGLVLLCNGYLELLRVLAHEKHPKGWIDVQLLGCSSVFPAGLFLFHGKGRDGAGGRRREEDARALRGVRDVRLDREAGRGRIAGDQRVEDRTV